MAVSIVTGTTTKVSDASSTSPLTITLRQTPTPGNLLVIGLVMGNNSNSGLTITDNQSGNTYTRIDSTSDLRVAMFYAKNINASGTFTISLNNGSGITFKNIVVYEVAGVDPVTPFTGGNVAYNTSTANATTGAAPTSSLSNTVANSIFFSVVSDTFTSNSATVTPGSGWSIDATNAAITGGASFEVGGMDYMVVSSIASQTQTWVLNNSVTYNALIACFNAATTSIPVTDSGTGSDTIGILVIDNLTDSGIGSDSTSISTGLNLSESGSGTDIQNITSSALISDSGSGSDLQSVQGNVTPTDSGSGSDSQSIFVNVPISDSGSGVENPSINTSFSVSDSGSGSDTELTSSNFSVVDIGSGADAIAVIIKLLLNESGIASDLPIYDIWQSPDSMPTFVEHLQNQSGQTLTPTIVSNYLDLVFSMISAANAFLYMDASNIADYMVRTGDYLLYDVYWVTNGAKIALDLTCTDNTNLRTINPVDQNGFGSHPNTDLSSVANSQWYHREIPLSSLVGKTVNKFDFACEYDAGGTIEGYIQNVYIRNTNFNIYAQLGLSESGSGSDIFSIFSVLATLAENGLGSDTASLLAAIGLSDAGSGSDSESAKITLNLSDAGIGSDTLANFITLLLNENGIGNDGISTASFFSLSDAGFALDIISVLVFIVLFDTGIGNELLSVFVQLLLSDIVSALDSLVFFVTILLAESGSGVDQVASIMSILLNEVAVGVDILWIFAVGSRMLQPVGQLETGNGQMDEAEGELTVD